MIRETGRRVDEFTRNQRPPIDNFVVCDPGIVSDCLDWIVSEQLAPGERFCEWGSGFGVASMVAALHGFHATGIEVEACLVDEARRLADDLAIHVHFEQGSFIPDDAFIRDDAGIQDEAGDWLTGDVEFDAQDLAHIDTDSPDVYSNIGQGIEDFDLFFAFPWPGEESYWEAIFNHYAADGALLMTYHGIEQLKLRRRVA